MSIFHLFLAFLVAVIWGINFLFVKISLDVFSPLTLCAVRFTLASIPGILFIKPPAMPFKKVVSYGLVMFALQFSFLFWGMSMGITPGLTALIMQVQVAFSLLFAAIFLGEKPSEMQIIGACVSFLGIGLIGSHMDSSLSWGGFFCILACSATWGLGNLMIKKTNEVNMLALVIWGSFVACPCMLMFALFIEGPSSFMHSYQHYTGSSLIAVLYVSYISTLVGYGLWNWLLSRYPLGMVAPFTLLTPVVGMLTSFIFLDESLDTWKIFAGLLMIGGLCINIFSPRLSRMRQRLRFAEPEV